MKRSEPSEVPTLGYWNIRGLAEPIRLLLEYCGESYKDVRYQQGGAPDYSREEWLAEKEKLGLDFPNLPYYIDGTLIEYLVTPQANTS